MALPELNSSSARNLSRARKSRESQDFEQVVVILLRLALLLEDGMRKRSQLRNS